MSTQNPYQQVPRPMPLQPGQPGRPMPQHPGGRPIPLQPGAARQQQQQRRQQGEEGDEEEEGAQRLPDYLRNAPPWLVSTVVHVMIIIILALWYTMLDKKSDLPELSAEWHEEKGEQLEDDRFEVEVKEPNDAKEAVLEEKPVVENPFAAPQMMEVTAVEGFTAVSDIKAPSIGMALDGREDGMKAALLGKYGGNGQSEQAVTWALEWLARVQDSHTGGWSLKGKYADGAQYENTSSATAMALLAFQGAGNTHKKGKFKKNVQDGWDFLLKEQSADGLIFGDGPSRQMLYTHGQCTIAVCEMWAMTKDPKFKGPAEKAVDFCVKSQDRLGGWRYTPGSDSDTSVTGWIMMGLQSARMGGLNVPKTTLDGIGRYLDKASKAGGAHYGYQAGSSETPVMTAEGLLCREYLGWKQNDTRLTGGCDWLLGGHMPRWNQDDRNVYYWYYATQVMHHIEGTRWTRWNDVMRDMMVDHQTKSGAEKGSWDPVRPVPDKWGYEAGRLYTTCLSVYILEVYYRHLPIYAKFSL